MRSLFILCLTALSTPIYAQELLHRTPAGLPATELVQIWLQQDPSVQEAVAELQTAEHSANMLQASPHEWNLKLSSQRRSYTSDQDSNEWVTQLERTLRLPNKRALDYHLGKVEIELAEAKYGEAMHETARDFVDLYTQWLSARRAHELMQEQITFSEESLRVVQLRRQSGDASTLEVNAVEADIAGIRGRLSDAVSEEHKALATLQIRFPGAGAHALTLADPESVVETEQAWKTRILSTSDPLKITEVRLVQAEIVASRARMNRLPDPTIGLYTGSEVYSNEKIVGISVTIPIPGRYRNQQLGQALAHIEMARAARDRQKRLLEIEVSDAYADAIGNYERWRLAETSAAKTRDNANLTQRAYSLGEVDLQTLLLSRRQALEAVDSALDARVSALKSYYQLLVDAHLIWGLEHS
jgi:cobalt-zinc-cadmium efflux system outer membrane protein